jgi:hypothetical protein
VSVCCYYDRPADTVRFMPLSHKILFPSWPQFHSLNFKHLEETIAQLPAVDLDLGWQWNGRTDMAVRMENEEPRRFSAINPLLLDSCCFTVVLVTC